MYYFKEPSKFVRNLNIIVHSFALIFGLFLLFGLLIFGVINLCN